MERPDAERVFRLVAELHGELHERLVPDRWWLVWTLMGFEILFTNTLTHVLIRRGELRAGIHFGIFAAQIAALAGTIRIAQRHSGGVRAQREMFIWWIWTTFLLAAGVAVLLNMLLALPLFAMACVLPLLAAVGFSATGMIADRAFVVAALIFAACSVAMALLPSVQFLTYGATWFLTLEGFGYLHRPRTPIAGRAM